MKIDTVIECVNKLSTNYDLVINEKTKEEKIKLLFDTFKNKPDSSLKYACDKVMRDGNIKKFPTIVQLESYMPIMSAQDQMFCGKCEGAGYYNTWQRRENSAQYYSFAYRCPCNTSTMQSMPTIDIDAIPDKAHNPYPPIDKRHLEFTERN